MWLLIRFISPSTHMNFMGGNLSRPIRVSEGMVKEAGALYVVTCPVCGHKIYGSSKRKALQGLKYHVEWRHRLQVEVVEEEEQ
jgi:hypothetical protein